MAILQASYNLLFILMIFDRGIIRISEDSGSPQLGNIDKGLAGYRSLLQKYPELQDINKKKSIGVSDVEIVTVRSDRNLEDTL